MQCRRPRRHEKTFHEPKGEAEGDERNIVQFPERRKAIPPPDAFFGIERELSINEQFPDEPKLELLPPEKILLGAGGRRPVGVAATAPTGRASERPELFIGTLTPAVKWLGMTRARSKP